MEAVTGHFAHRAHSACLDPIAFPGGARGRHYVRRANHFSTGTHRMFRAAVHLFQVPHDVCRERHVGAPGTFTETRADKSSTRESRHGRRSADHTPWPVDPRLRP